MNLPNKLTLMRIILVPFFVAALLIPFPLHNLTALIIFAAASITDLLDGKIARKHNLVTDFGKFADPLADKILVLAALLCFVQNGLCDCVAVILVLLREFSVTSVRLIAASKGKVIAANIWGKIKTVTQMIAIIGIFCSRAADEFTAVFTFIPSFIGSWLMILSNVVLYTAVAATIFSGARYMYDAREFFKDL